MPVHISRAVVWAFATLSVTPFLLHGASGSVERGKYLVENVAMCGDCHTPATAQGPDMSKWLKGSVLGFQPINPIPGWHKTAPDLTGTSRLFQRWGEAGMVKFLETGMGPSGHKADPPMPTYKMHAADAEAVVAYLKSLK